MSCLVVSLENQKVVASLQEVSKDQSKILRENIQIYHYFWQTRKTADKHILEKKEQEMNSIEIEKELKLKWNNSALFLILILT